jgi:cytochrome c2
MNRVGLTALLVVVSIAAVSCSHSVSGQKAGTERNAPDLIIQYGCPTCHVIPNVPGAVGQVGPSLRSVSQRSYLAGSLPNTPENLEQWIMHPQHYRPGTAMPEMEVTQPDARRIATFLESNP